MTTRSGEPAAGSLALKTFRVRKCGVKLRMQEAEFTCQREKHTQDESHTEAGFVMMPNGTARRYTMIWYDEGVAHFRHTKKAHK